MWIKEFQKHQKKGNSINTEENETEHRKTIIKKINGAKNWLVEITKVDPSPSTHGGLREIRKTQTSHARRKSINNIQFIKMFKRDYLRQYRKQMHEYVYHNG